MTTASPARHGSAGFTDGRPGSPASASQDGHGSTQLTHAARAGVQGGTGVQGGVGVVVGIGARAGTGADEVLAAVDAVLPPGARVTALATVDRRAAEPGVQAAAAARGWSLVALPVDRLAQVPVPTVSARVAAALGTPSVAEAAALAGGGELLVPKTVHGRVTVAVAVP